jgi:fermentation-respiration switch protein FrsA (DUF1100 family)
MLIKMIERSLVYPIPSRERGDWRPRWLRPQNVWFRSGDNTKLHGWYVPAADPARLLVYCHGNGEHVADLANLVFRLQSYLSATVFVFDYRGYGRSRGKPIENGCVADGLAAQRWLADREGVATNEVIVMGRSIGGGVAVAMAAEQGAHALVLENTFSRMTDAAAALYPWLPVRLVMRNRYNSLRRIERCDSPLFQCHGTADEIVPIELGRRLHEAAPSPLKHFFEIPNGRHNDTPPPVYYSALAQFLDQVEAGARPTPAVPVRRRRRQLVS